MVVNGSGFKPSPISVSSRHPSTSESLASEESVFDNPLRINHGLGINGNIPEQQEAVQPLLVAEPSAPQFPERPVVVNGSTHSPVAPPNPATVQSFGQHLAAINGFSPVAYATVAGNNPNDAMQWTSTRHRVTSRQQPKGIAPLDLALPEHALMQDLQHLSPVYENRTPSPTVVRDLKGSFGHTPAHYHAPASSSKEGRKDPLSKPFQKNVVEPTGIKPEVIPSPVQNPRVNGIAARENGHVRSAKSESGETAGWQKPRSRKKTADLKTAANGYAQGEQLPKNEADRKGG